LDPPSFVLSENNEHEVEVTVNVWSDDFLDATTAVLVPVVFSCNGKKTRSFLLCVLTTPKLNKKNRLSLLTANEGSELWGETMSSEDMVAAGLASLLEDLTAMPESKAPVIRLFVYYFVLKRKHKMQVKNAQPRPRDGRSATSGAVPFKRTKSSDPVGAARVVREKSSETLLRQSDSMAIKNVVSNARLRTASGGNREDMPAEAGGSSSVPGSTGFVMSNSGSGGSSATTSSTSSPRIGMLANVRARLTRNRSGSAGTEEEGTPVVKERRSPRSPRIEETWSWSATGEAPRGKGDVSPPSGVRPVLQSRSSTEKAAVVVRKRDPSEVERKPGWVASMERSKSPKQEPAPEEKTELPPRPVPASKSTKQETEEKTELSPRPVPGSKSPKQEPAPEEKTELPRRPMPEKREIGGPPKKKLPSPRPSPRGESGKQLDRQD
jgi:hypothetical protein